MRKYLLIIMAYTITASGIGYAASCSKDDYTVKRVGEESYGIENMTDYTNYGEVVPIIVGEEITIYGDEVASVPINNSLKVIYTCNIGSQSGNNYVITAGAVGDVFLYINATNGSSTVRKTRSLLSIKNKVNTGSKTITIIGNSLVALGGDDELVLCRSIFDSMTWTGIGLVGGAPNSREGYSGKTYDWLVNHADSPFTKAGVLDIPAYYTDNGFNVPDFIYMRMGVNDAWNERAGDWTDAEKTIWLADIKELIDAFLAHDANIKIIVGLPPICVDSTAGWQASYPGDPYQDSYITIIHQMWDAIIETYSDYDARVTVAYAPWGLDRDDGYPKTDGVHTNGVHPAGAGYNELGQGLAFALNNLL